MDLSSIEDLSHLNAIDYIWNDKSHIDRLLYTFLRLAAHVSFHLNIRVTSSLSVRGWCITIARCS